MAYTASALSFMLENLSKPVVVTGAQIPISELRNVAVDNLLGSMLMAGHFEIPEVTLLFRGCLMRGNRTWKESSKRMESFVSPNLDLLAKVDFDIEVEWDNILPMPADPLMVHSHLETNLAVVTMFPGIPPQLLAAQLAPPVAGAVLQTYGSGSMSESPAILEVLLTASKQGVLLVAITQCARGSVENKLGDDNILQAADVIGLGDMTLEAALTKMAVVLGHGMSIEKARAAMAHNLAGELAVRAAEQHLELSSGAFVRAVGKALGSFGPESQEQIQKVLLPMLVCSAASAGDVSQLQGFCRTGESLDCVDHDQRSPLHVASAEGHEACVKFLIEKKI